MLKRVFDIIASLMGLILLSPVILITAILVRTKLGSPIFFTQDRVGKDNKIFKMIKFRTMSDERDEYGELLSDEYRLTSFGKFLRSTSIDELPELINVLKGDMSLVGPRPSLPSEVEQYTKYDRQRLYVTPGCTGLWQATERSNVGFSEMVKLDLEYIQRASLSFDLWIIWKTIEIIFKPNSSY